MNAKKMISKGIYIAGAFSILSALTGVIMLFCCVCLLESGSIGFVKCFLMGGIGAVLFLPMIILQQILGR